MAAVASIVLNDGLATPVAHTFVPLGPDQKGVWWFEDQSASSPIGYDRISLQLVRSGNPAPGSNAGSMVNRVKMGIHCPTLATMGTNDAGILPPPTVDYIDRCNIEFILPAQDNIQNREDVRVYANQLLINAQVIAMIEQLQNVY